MLYYTNNNFDSYTHNPYNNNQPYDSSWVLLKLIEYADFKSFTGNNDSGIFRLILTKRLSEWKFCVMDFIEYEKSHNKSIIIAVNPKDLDLAKTEYAGHCCTDNLLRSYEHPVLVHTTTPTAYRKILKSGYLKSWNMLNNNFNSQPIGAKLGDPIDYSDYIMFNNGGFFSELVVASKEKGYINMDIHTSYTAGGRFYFDAEKIAKDGLLVRDGTHLKVRDYLELNKYLLWIATPELVGLSDETTPYEFGTKSDEMFERKFGIHLCDTR